jgi:hypothetical protein
MSEASLVKPKIDTISLDAKNEANRDEYSRPKAKVI